MKKGPVHMRLLGTVQVYSRFDHTCDSLEADLMEDPAATSQKTLSTNPSLHCC